MPIHSVWIINKAGGLVYQRTIDSTFHPKLSSNDYLVMASTFQSIHAISAKVSPVAGSGGIKHMDLLLGGTQFSLHALQSPTGIKMIMTTTSSGTSTSEKKLADPVECEKILKKLFAVYTDYSLKNPFQAPEMPIKSEAFDDALVKAVS